MNERTAAWRGEFPGLEQSDYRNTCSLGQLSSHFYNTEAENQLAVEALVDALAAPAGA